MKKDSSPEKMKIAYSDVRKALFLCCFQALRGVFPRGEGEIVHLKVGVKGQQCIGNSSVKRSNEAGQASYFLDIDIAGDQQCAGDEEGGFLPLL